MELGLSTSLLGPGALPEGLAVFGAAGVPWVEIHGYMPEEFDFSDAALIDATRRALERCHIRLWSCHSPSGEAVDLASSDADLRRRSRAVLEEAMRASAALGARIFVCDAARPHTGDSPAQADARRRLYADGLRVLLDGAARLGLRFVIENQPRGGARFVSPEDFLRLEGEYGLVGLEACWDTGHGWIAGQAAEAACRLGPRLATIHAHDNDGKGDRHWLPSKGGIAWAPFLACLRRIGYGGPFMMELGPPDPRTPEAVQRLVDDAVTVYHRLVEPGPG
ncbi:MAG: sugar phosphate isomerase/epimerase [Bacillati bacterium ANGP1]|uniref:Sugar phosphate isomerase/epimerase n=1 Tax=Candidatus Segetimicrobium genomatis TaxID=2569760 RepID=A0A537K3A4_9BACT|nr:MAG: sugar phosphate isomerase/epimerase [Terrabacteria group bacterium ANGP1]